MFPHKELLYPKRTSVFYIQDNKDFKANVGVCSITVILI